jgi:hypothetical protein
MTAPKDVKKFLTETAPFHDSGIFQDCRYENSSIAVLDEDLKPLMTSGLLHGADLRLFVVGDEILVSSWCKIDEPHFYWTFSRLELATDSTGEHLTAKYTELDRPGLPPNITFDQARNLGVITHGNSWYALWSFLESENHHNSINPLALPELNAYLGVMHKHTWQTDTPSWYGTRYAQYFFLMDDQPPFRVRKVSRGFCIPSLTPQSIDTCEIIQFVGSIIRDPSDPTMLLIAYGVNDCEAAVVPVPLDAVLSSMEIVDEQKQSLHGSHLELRPNFTKLSE